MKQLRLTFQFLMIAALCLVLVGYVFAAATQARSASDIRFVSDWTTVPAGTCINFYHPLARMPFLAQIWQAYAVNGTLAGGGYGDIYLPDSDLIVLRDATSTRINIYNYGLSSAILRVVLE